MQLLSISTDTTLSQLADIVGSNNIPQVLSANGLKRTPNIGAQYSKLCEAAIASNVSEVSWERKASLLNNNTDNFDIFEAIALQDTRGWKLVDTKGVIPDTLSIPDSINLPVSDIVLGNKQKVPNNVYSSVMNSLSSGDHQIDPSIFNDSSNILNTNINRFLNENTTHDLLMRYPQATRRGYSHSGGSVGDTPFQMFHLPWGLITLYSSLDNSSIDFPVYPEEYEDGRVANYTQMPDMLYQYEPWQVYQSSGPRTNEFTFHFHRDMWSGDHRDGKAAELIRFCEANCYPDYRGSAVLTSTVTLYICGKPLISGILTSTSTKWGGPIGLDGFYLECTLSISITEVAKDRLDYSTVKAKGLID